MQQCVWNRQESINNQFKFWGCLAQKFWHEIPQHGDCFWYIAVVIQLAINASEGRSYRGDFLEIALQNLTKIPDVA